ncbi:uncharacterized protein [Diadema setosum]|uniref:uncharacterized protein n=1 Tax=Diadema setosum TaxID=31175 RepID=UPI003B3BE1CF
MSISTKRIGSQDNNDVPTLPGPTDQDEQTAASPVDGKEEIKKSTDPKSNSGPDVPTLPGLTDQDEQTAASPADGKKGIKNSTDPKTGKSNSGAGRVTRRRTGPKATFPWTDTQEEDLVVWWQRHTVLYNNLGAGFFDKKRKDKLFANKAKEIGSGCTAKDVQTHLRSLRTKLNHILKHPTHGKWREPKTPREKWVWDRLHFIRPFISHRDKNQSTKKNKGSSEEDSQSEINEDAIAMDALPDSDNEGESMSSNLDNSTSSMPKLQPESRRKRNKGAAQQNSPATKQDIPAKRARATEADEEEVDSFLAHLRCTLLRVPADVRMEMQAHILVMVYSRLRDEMQPNAPSESSENGQMTGST